MRYIQFDALRGMAAISVLLSHFIGMLPAQPDWLVLFSKTPIHILWDGAAAVNLFFVLSGFCVALPYMRRESPRQIAYVSFLIRRIFRLYPAYLVALIMCWVAKTYYVCPSVDRISTWGAEFWQWESLSFSQWLALIAMIYHADTNLLDPPTWSLVVEMKMAFVLPMMFWSYQKLQIKWQVLLTIIFMIDMICFDSPLRYSFHFALGVMLARAKDFISDNIACLATKKIIILFVASLFFYTCRWPWLDIIIGEVGGGGGINAFFEIANGIGSALLIILFFHPRIVKVLSNRFGGFLGEISYSIYLIHFPILMLCVSFFSSWYMIFGTLFVVSLALAWFMYKFVEKPLILIGRFASEKHN